MSRLSLFALPLLLASCALIEPYTITFTTPKDASVDPATSTLDLVVSAPAYAYISEADCDGADHIDLLPVITDDMEPSAAHNLALTMLNGAPGAKCKITVTAFDESTTSSSRASTTVVIATPAAQAPVETTPTVEVPTVDTQVQPEMPTTPVEGTPTQETPAE